MENEVRLDDGFSTIITLSGAPTIKIWEKTVTPPGYSANGPIDITTMRNTTWRTNSPKQLKTLTQASATVAYATETLALIVAQIGVNQLITVTFPDESTLAFWGWVEEFTPGTNTEGEQPTATMTIGISNHNNSGTEVAPDYTAPSGSEV